MQLKPEGDNRYYEKLINEHLHVLEQFANQKVNQLIRNGIKNISKGEIISIGYEGLYKAAIKFDESRNNDFSGFAWYYIDFAFKAYQRNIDSVHHVTRKQIKNIRKATDALSQKLGRQPTDGEIAESLKMDTQQIQKYRNIEITNLPYMDDTNSISESDVKEFVLDFNHEDQDSKLNLGRDMNHCIEISLTGDQRVIIEWMYMEDLNAREIAMKLWGKFGDTEKNLIYNTTKSGKSKLKKCMENKGWSKGKQFSPYLDPGIQKDRFMSSKLIARPQREQRAKYDKKN